MNQILKPLDELTNAELVEELLVRLQRGVKQETLNNTIPTKQKKMYPAVCTICGKDTEVPFEPFSGAKIKCRECYMNAKRATE